MTNCSCWGRAGWDARAGVVQSTLMDSVEMSERYFSQLVPRMIISGLSVLVLVSYVFTLDRNVGLVVTGCTLLALVTPIISAQLLRVRSRFWWEKYFPLNAEYLDNVQGMATLKAFNAAVRRGSELKADADAICVASIRLMWLEALYSCVVGLAIGMGSAVSVGLGALHLAEGTITVASLLLILLLVSECFRPVRALQQAFHQAFWVTSVSDSIFSLLDAAPLVTEASHPGVPSGPLSRFLPLPTSSPPAVAGTRKRAAPADLWVKVRTWRGVRCCALSILPLPTAQRTSRRCAIFNNLRLAKPAATDAEIEAAARAASIHDFVASLPLGYETAVGERGLKLSGGERQRIAIARALLKDAPLLILDEATSSVDIANEAVIQGALATVMRGRTTLIIAHRLSTIRSADRIVVLEGGRVVESGTYDELVAAGGVFTRLTAMAAAIVDDRMIV